MCVQQARGVLEVSLKENECRPLADSVGEHVGLPQVCAGEV